MLVGYQVTFFSGERLFLITIPRCKQKAGRTLLHLRERGIWPELFHGIDAEVSGLETKWTYELDHPGSGYRIGPKLVNMQLSHYLLWKVASYLPNDIFVIFEDDVRFEPGWKEHFDIGVTHLPEDWDLIYLGSCCVEERRDNQVIWGRLAKVSGALCTHAYAVRRKALPVFLDNMMKVWANIDIAIQTDVMPHLNCFAFVPRLAYQHETVIPP